MRTGAPSYFDFLMKHRCSRRPRVPFAQAVGIMPDFAHVLRSRVPQRMQPVAPKGGNRAIGQAINRGSDVANRSPNERILLTPTAA